MKKTAGLIMAAVCIPYLAVLFGTGSIEGQMKPETLEAGVNGRSILLDRGVKFQELDLEEYLIGMLAAQIPAEYEPETLKAQAVIARTYLYRQMGEDGKIAESALDTDWLELNQLEQMWGKRQYLKNYRKLKDAVEKTKGQTMRYEGEWIDPLFHRISAGKTRTGDALHPYLQSVDGTLDEEAEDYMEIQTFGRDTLAEKLNAMAESPGISAECVSESIQIIKRDEAGYIDSVLVGSKEYTGEELQYALGLPSAAVYFEPYEQEIRCITKGIGHGYGFDQYGADRRAKEGWTAEELLKYYYKNIVLISE